MEAGSYFSPSFVHLISLLAGSEGVNLHAFRLAGIKATLYFREQGRLPLTCSLGVAGRHILARGSFCLLAHRSPASRLALSRVTLAGVSEWDKLNLCALAKSTE